MGAEGDYAFPYEPEGVSCCSEATVGVERAYEGRCRTRLRRFRPLLAFRRMPSKGNGLRYSPLRVATVSIAPPLSELNLDGAYRQRPLSFNPIPS